MATDTPKLLTELSSAFQLRQDLEYVPEAARTQPISDSMFDVCMRVRNQLAIALDLPEPTWHVVLPGELLRRDSTYAEFLSPLVGG